MWQDRAACAGMDSRIFLSGVTSRVNIAKAVCNSCPVIQECLSFALANEDYEPHVYGGMTGEERKRIALAVA
jgi:WhiB family redox-sensing transcriptional regulator